VDRDEKFTLFFYVSLVIIIIIIIISSYQHSQCQSKVCMTVCVCVSSLRPHWLCFIVLCSFLFCLCWLFLSGCQYQCK